jgi:hypothetical protein
MKILLNTILLIIALMFSYSCSQNQSEQKGKKIVEKTKYEKKDTVDLVSNRNEEFYQKSIDSISIDGVINKLEWSKSIKYNLYGGDSLFFLKSNDTLFIAVRGNSGGFTSMGFSNGNQIKVLHSSTGLITAEYAKNNNKWQLAYDFKDPRKKSGVKYPRNTERLGSDYKKSQEEQFGWYANLIEMGNPSETEFMIPISSLPNGDLYFSIVFYQINSNVKKAKFPKNLSDAMLNQELISGSAKNNMNFMVETWFNLSEVINN